MTALYITLTCLLGICVGSFLNVVIYRLPNNMSLVRPASHCPKCNYQLKWSDNVPLLSYILLGGKCRNCKEKISFRYPFVEVLNMVLWFLCLLCFTNVVIPTNEPNYVKFVVSCLMCSTLICVFFCDYDNMEIPDTFQAILLFLGLVSIFSNDIAPTERAIGFFVGFGFFALILGLYYLVRKKEGLGFGDIKLMACLGLILGVWKTILTIIISSVVGAVVLLILNAVKKGEKDREYPFAVFIVPAALLALFIGDIIIKWYQSILML